MRRFGEDAPDIAITEMIVADGDSPPEVTVALRPDGQPDTSSLTLAWPSAKCRRQGSARVSI
jgi:hypothetical protein